MYYGAAFDRPQTVDKVPDLHRGFSSVDINVPIIFPLFIKKKFLLSTRKLSGAFSVHGMVSLKTNKSVTEPYSTVTLFMCVLFRKE